MPFIVFLVEVESSSRISHSLLELAEFPQEEELAFRIRSTKWCEAAATMRAILASGDAATLHVASSGLKALCSRIAGGGH